MEAVQSPTKNREGPGIARERRLRLRNLFSIASGSNSNLVNVRRATCISALSNTS